MIILLVCFAINVRAAIPRADDFPLPLSAVMTKGRFLCPVLRRKMLLIVCSCSGVVLLSFRLSSADDTSLLRPENEVGVIITVLSSSSIIEIRRLINRLGSMT